MIIRRLFRAFAPVDTHSQSSPQLRIEPLEDRTMLSLVLIGVEGAMGGENIRIFIDGELKREGELGAFPDIWGVSSDGPVELDDIRVEFTNDLYLPEQGIDRNVIISSLSIDFVQQEFDTSSTFSTGTWTAKDGVTPGFGRGTVLHTNGYIQFAAETATSLEFLGNEWTADQPFGPNQATVDENGGFMFISGEEGPFALSREISIEPGTPHEFSVNAYRRVISGSFESDNSPWATAGINFYDANGNLVKQETIEINSGFQSLDDEQQKTVIVSDDITSAYMWIWVDGVDEGTKIPLYLNDISFTPLDTSGDTTAPQATFEQTEVSSSPGNEINFAITFTDDRFLASPSAGAAPNAIRVTSQNGFDGIAVQRTGTPDFSDTRQTIVYGLVKSDGSDWTESDNGVYTLFLQEGTLVDAAGNVAPAEQFSNPLIVAIQPKEADTEPASISLKPVGPFTSIPRNGFQFIVNTADNNSPGPFSRDLRITSDNGFDQTIGGTAGGFDSELNQSWQLYIIQSPLANGTYTITLPEGELVDQAGNVTPSQVLGTFVVSIDGAVA